MKIYGLKSAPAWWKWKRRTSGRVMQCVWFEKVLKCLN